MNIVFCIGNGESRKDIDLSQFRPHGKIYGCNALYRDFTPDVLTAVDHGIMHEIYQSGYCDKNETWLRNWTRIPAPVYDTLVYADMSSEDKELLDKHQSNKLENDRGNRQEFVFHGSNLAGRVNIIKQNKDIVKKQVNHTATFVSWTSDTDKAKNIDDLVEGERDKGWACGATSGRIATINEKGLTEMYLIGHDLVSNTDKINNLYKDTKYYGITDNIPTPSVNWIDQWKSVITENPQITFYKVNPEGNHKVNQPIIEWSGLKNLKYISIQTTLDNFVKI
tara:strand:+ start:1175 stop:2014 length:840 start_codon:yes stop_codon:yes gene_type:complete